MLVAKSLVLRLSLIALALVSVISTSLANSDTLLLLKALGEAQNDSAKVSIYIELGSMVQDNNPARANHFFVDALQLSKDKEGEFFKKSTAICYNRKGIISTIRGDYSQSVAYYQDALEIFTGLSEQHPGTQAYLEGIANILANIGTIYYHQEYFSKAIEYWEKAAGAIRILNIPYDEALLLNNIGIIYRERKDLGKALEYYNKALEIFETEESEKDIAMCYTNIGDVYGDMGLYSKALELFNKSLGLKLRHGDKHGIIQCYLSISNLYFNMKEFPMSIGFSEKAMALSEQIDDRKDLRNGYELLSKNYAAQGNYQQAYDWYWKYKTMNDSIFNKESQDKFMELQSQYESKVKENEIIVLRQTEGHQRLIKEILIAGIAFILIISAWLIFSIVSKRRKDKTIHQQEKKLLEQEKQLINSELATKDLKTKELNQEIDFKTRQLTTHALHIMQKNKMLYELIGGIDVISKSARQEIRPDLRRLKMQVKQSLKTEKDWDVFKLYFEQVNKDFFDELIKLTPDLSTHDLRHCALIKLNLNIKETASVLNLSPNSIKSARYRLKKKLALGPEDDLFEFIREISASQ